MSAVAAAAVVPDEIAAKLFFTLHLVAACCRALWEMFLAGPSDLPAEGGLFGRLWIGAEQGASANTSLQPSMSSFGRGYHQVRTAMYKMSRIDQPISSLVEQAPYTHMDGIELIVGETIDVM